MNTIERDPRDENFQEDLLEESKSKKSKSHRRKKHKSRKRKSSEPSLVLKNIKDERTLEGLLNILRLGTLCKSKIKLSVKIPETPREEISDELEYLRFQKIEDFLAQF